MLPMTSVCSADRDILTSSGQKIDDNFYILKLLESVQLPKSLAIIEIPGHSMTYTKKTRGNHLVALLLN